MGAATVVRPLRIINTIFLVIIFLVAVGLIKITWQSHVFAEQVRWEGVQAGSWLGLYYATMIPAEIFFVLLYFGGRAMQVNSRQWVHLAGIAMIVILGITPGLIFLYSLFVKNF